MIVLAERPSLTALTITLVLHTALIIGLSWINLATKPTTEIPMFIEVTLAGNNAPYSRTEGAKGKGKIMGSDISQSVNKGKIFSPAELKAWKEKKRREIIKNLNKTREKFKLGTDNKKLLKQEEGLAVGRGAAEWGKTGSPLGTLSLSGDIAARGYRQPDFEILKSLITEETQLKLVLLVTPTGEVKKASLLQTSGYPFLDQKTIELARKIVFDPLPPNWQQVEQQGVLTIKLKL